MRDKKMLAVRLPPELVAAVKEYAATERKSTTEFMEELIRRGLAKSKKGAQGKREEMDAATRKKLYNEFRLAQKRGEIMYWVDKKMLAVRLSPELIAALNTYAIRQEKNTSTIVEEFIRLELAQKRGEVIDEQTVARLVSRNTSPYRIRNRRTDGGTHPSENQ